MKDGVIRLPVPDQYGLAHWEFFQSSQNLVTFCHNYSGHEKVRLFFWPLKSDLVKSRLDTISHWDTTELQIQLLFTDALEHSTRTNEALFLYESARLSKNRLE